MSRALRLATALMVMSTITQGCDPLRNFIKAGGGTDTIGDMSAADSGGAYTEGSNVIGEIIVAEQEPAPAPERLGQTVAQIVKAYNAEMVK